MAISQIEKHVGQRFEKILPYLNRGKKEFANEIGINESQFSRMIQGKAGISPKVIFDVSSIYNVRIEWLFTGEEPMFKKDQAAKQAPDQITLSKEQLEAVRVSLEKLNSIFPAQMKTGTSTNAKDQKGPWGKKSHEEIQRNQRVHKAKDSGQKKDK